MTRFCLHPSSVRALPKVGGTKDVDLDRVLALSPELVVANAEENTREIFEAIEGAGLPLYVAFPKDVDGALSDLRRLGQLVDRPADDWIERIQAARGRLPRLSGRFLYLIWRKPWMAAGPDTFISRLLGELGLENALTEGDRYPIVDPWAVGADHLLLSSEPFPFAEKHRVELAGAAASIRLIDGEACSWHGTAMARGFEDLIRWAQPA